MIDLSGKDDLSLIRHLDDKIDNNIKALLESCGLFYYTIEDLDKQVNESETLREYILDTESTFHVTREKPLEEFSGEELTEYVVLLDKLYSEVVI